METLGILVFGLGLAFLVAGMVSFALNREAPGSDESARGKADEGEHDLFTIDNIDDEFVEAAIQPPEATELNDEGRAAATLTARS
jgi:hypothetical protein